MTKVKVQFRGPNPDSKNTHFARLVTSQNSFPRYACDFNPDVYLWRSLSCSHMSPLTVAESLTKAKRTLSRTFNILQNFTFDFTLSKRKDVEVCETCERGTPLQEDDISSTVGIIRAMNTDKHR